MFNKNIDALKILNTDFATKISQISLEEAKEKISAYNSSSGDVIIARENIALDDINDPIEKAKELYNSQVKNNLAKTDFVVLYGFGIGYLFKRAYISSDARIYVYEKYLDVLRFVFEYIDFSTEILSGRVRFFDSEENLHSNIKESYLSGDNIEITYLESYATKNVQELIDFSKNIFEICKSKIADVNTIKLLSKYWARNIVLNSKYLKQVLPVNLLKNKFEGKVALILGAGPSLKTNIDLIKSNRDKFVIFSVNKIADYLYENAITPDFIVAADAHKVELTMRKASEYAKNINIISTLKTDNFVFAQKAKNNIVYLLDVESIDSKLTQKFPAQLAVLETAGTAIAQAYISAFIMGFEKIVFGGMDLAFKGDEVYFNVQVNIDDKNGNVILPHYDAQNRLLYSVRGLREIKSFAGKSIYTRDDYALFIRQMEELFRKYKTPKLYNITDFGAYIEGMEYLPLKEILDNIIEIKNEVTTFDVIDIAKQEASCLIDNMSEFVLKIVEDEKEIIFNLKETLEKWLEAKNLLYKTPQKIEFSDLEKIKQEEIQILKTIVNSEILSLAFQTEILGYTEMNNSNQNSQNNDFYSIRVNVFNLFKLINEELANIIAAYNLL